jgi:hypothetical protein
MMLTNGQLYLAIGLPCLAIMASLVISLVQISGIRDDMRMMRSEFSDRIDGLRTELLSQMQLIREDIKLMMSKLADLETRVSVIEERIKR